MLIPTSYVRISSNLSVSFDRTEDMVVNFDKLMKMKAAIEICPEIIKSKSKCLCSGTGSRVYVTTAF